MNRLDSAPDRTPGDERAAALVQVRAILRTDAAELERFYTGLSPESRQADSSRSARGSVRRSPTRSARPITITVRASLRSSRGPGRHERIVGHLCLEPDGAAAAEVAIAVADQFQRQGIGRRLMAAGVAWARDEHIASLTATMLARNAPIHRLLAGLGLPTALRDIGAGVAEITIDLVAQSVAA